MLAGTFGYLLSTITYLVFFGILLTDKHRGATKTLFLMASMVCAFWSVSLAVQSASDEVYLVPQLLEIIKNVAWIALLFQMLSTVYAQRFSRNKLHVFFVIILVSAIALLIPILYQYLSGRPMGYGENEDLLLVIHLFFSVVGIVLIEQLYRSSHKDHRWVIKYICISLAGMFIYEFYMYSDALLYKRIDIDLWSARGYIYSIIVPVMGISIVRDPLWAPEVFISRRVVFHTTTLIASSIYLLVMGTAGYYVKTYGGTWGHVGQAFLLFFTILGLFVFLSSKRIRATIKVLVNKHFYPYKYDYREEWLRFIETVAKVSTSEELNLNSINSIAQIIDSPAGQLWLRQEGGYFQCVETWNMPMIDVKEPTEKPLPKYLEEHEFVISIDEFRNNPEVYNRLGYLILPSWLEELDAWLVVPLIHVNRLIGFIVLAHTNRQRSHFNWEDSDLLKTAARQAASYIAHQQTTQALAVAKQFEEFNKMSTYMVHDIKNLITQLSLVTANAERHMDNPLFIRDAIKTIENSVEKMNALITRLRSKTRKPDTHHVDIIALLQELIMDREKAARKPIPILGCDTESVLVKGDKGQLFSIFSHLVQNAQDATEASGSIKITETTTRDDVVVMISDTGCGIERDFMENSLFKPFETTKGNTGMGIGLYESREIVKAIGGEVSVQSEVGKGTTFKVKIPIIKTK